MSTSQVDNYGWSDSIAPESCGYITPKVIAILKTLNIQKCCDLGSGNGALAAVLHGSGIHSVGVECDEQGIDISRINYPHIHFYQLGVQDDPAQVIDSEGGGFDAVVSTEVIEHLYSPHLLPQFARKMLSDGGYLVVSTPYHGYLKNLALSILDQWDKHHTSLWHGGHIKFWSRRTLSCLLEQNGFRVESFYGIGRLPWLWKSMILVARAV